MATAPRARAARGRTAPSRKRSSGGGAHRDGLCPPQRAGAAGAEDRAAVGNRAGSTVQRYVGVPYSDDFQDASVGLGPPWRSLQIQGLNTRTASLMARFARCGLSGTLRCLLDLAPYKLYFFDAPALDAVKFWDLSAVTTHFPDILRVSAAARDRLSEGELMT
ncbi:hypothetical protein CB1_001437010 [Camelus ferus]|nr:hypothetical protein CB1_001437010 [Camelus ferus]